MIDREAGEDQNSKLFLSFAPGRKVPHLTLSSSLQIGLQSSPWWFEKGPNAAIKAGTGIQFSLSLFYCTGLSGVNGVPAPPQRAAPAPLLCLEGHVAI